MATFKTTYTSIVKDGKKISIVDKKLFDSFNEDILGLGNIESSSQQINALSVIFDLEGFTDFCKQIDPQLAVPEYLSKFLKWIFIEIKKETSNKEYPEGIDTWSDLPFLSKYLGDGLLFLWDTKTMDPQNILNVIISMYEICQDYKNNFLPSISKSIVSPPTNLRCGIARGAIYSVGNGSDFVGPCINMSARLQSLHSLSFCFSRRGLNPEDMSELYSELFTTKKTDIRGIGTDELVCVVKSEFDKLNSTDKSKFKHI